MPLGSFRGASFSLPFTARTRQIQITARKSTLNLRAVIHRANNVGYAQNNLRAGAIGVGPQFVAVSAEKMDLCDIVPTGYNKATYEGGSINIQLLDYQGYKVPGSQYFWWDDEDGTAWFDLWDEEVERGDVSYDPGEALWAVGNDVKEAFRSSGEVANGSIDVFLRSGAKMICNPTPVAIPFNDDNKDGKFIAPSGYGASYEGGSINVQKLDYQGYKVAGSQFFWWDDEDGTAWFDLWDEEVEGEVLNPGEAIWVVGNSTDEKLNFPSAL